MVEGFELTVEGGLKGSGSMGIPGETPQNYLHCQQLIGVINKLEDYLLLKIR
ncbi:hypothetical protein HF078_04510 [Bacillus sp. RO2]|uniref:hypothetical protein n=1 Tax=Bacillus sp. RO2 TaxID=2723913 RepID=UPI00145D8674|nr:hypothetical protein [Bacillus sp. RO2]NMH72336.1 hypothetical protein [Bacillus sp. RO2]